MTLRLFVVCALVYCATYAAYGKIHDDHEIPVTMEEADCEADGMGLTDQMMEVACTPKKALVKLKPEPGYIYHPKAVSIERCSGICGRNLSCMPLKWAVVPILIRRHNIATQESSCYKAYVIRHTKCKCKCNVMEKDCNKRQVYSKRNCACDCKNIEEEVKCSQRPGMIWDPQKCKCMCNEAEQDCATGLEWIPSRCMCAKIMDPGEL